MDISKIRDLDTLFAEMDRLGVDGCIAQRDKIIAQARKFFDIAKFKRTMSAEAKRKIPKKHWSDPIPWMVDTAIQRAKEKKDKADAQERELYEKGFTAGAEWAAKASAETVDELARFLSSAYRSLGPGVFG